MITDSNLKINKQNSELSNHNRMITVLLSIVVYMTIGSETLRHNKQNFGF